MEDVKIIVRDGIHCLEGEQLWDTDILPVCLEHINEGDTVIDAGAWIGGHTMAYAEKVGVNGKAVAFEPNPYAIACLLRNIQQFQNVDSYQTALGDEATVVPLSLKEGWYDSSYVGQSQRVIDVVMGCLDVYDLSPNFIKIDVEGCELKALKGAAKTIDKHRPIMVIEVNHPALKRQGNFATEIFDWLLEHSYAYTPIDNYWNDVYNILATP